MRSMKTYIGKLGLLAGALSLSVLLSACADGEPAPPFEVDGSGTLEGLLFLDVNRDGIFDPSAGDRALSNVNVSLRERGGTAVIANATGKTNTVGRFLISGVPIGTHDLVVDTAGVGAGVAFCQNPIPVTIFLNESQFSNVAARAGCVITIAEAEAKAQGSTSTIAGIVTARPNQISATSGFWYIQDATGGTQLFGLLGGRTLAVGDSVEVTGTLTTFSNELEFIAPGQINVHVVGARTIAPTVVTTKQAGEPTSLTDPLLGRLVTVRKARQTNAFTAGGGRNATFDDGSGPVTVRIESGLVTTSADVTTRFPFVAPGKCFDITGILRNFSTGTQLTPRSLTEIVEVPCT